MWCVFLTVHSMSHWDKVTKLFTDNLFIIRHGDLFRATICWKFAILHHLPFFKSYKYSHIILCCICWAFSLLELSGITLYVAKHWSVSTFCCLLHASNDSFVNLINLCFKFNVFLLHITSHITHNLTFN